MHRGRVIPAIVAFLALAICPVVSRAQPPAGMVVSPVADRLATLIDAPGVSGREDHVRDAVASLLPAWAKPRVDELGNLVLAFGSTSGPATLVVAPLDEDGYVVSGITDEGYLRVHRPTREPVHRLFDQYHVGQPVAIQTRRNGTVPGVTATPSTHLRRFLPADEATRIRGLDDLWIDVGASSPSDVQRLGIRLLDAVALRERSQALGGGRVAGPSAQGRAAALALVELLRGWSAASSVSGSVTIAWMTQSLFGNRGLARLIESSRPQRVIVCGLALPARGKDGDPRGAVGTLGAGPLLPADAAALKRAAAARGVVVQDAAPDRFQVRTPAGWDGALEMIAVPVLFAQTPVETVDSADVAAMTRLVAAAVDAPPPAAQPSREAVPAGQAARVTAPADRPSGFGPLKALIEAYGVSGGEAAVRDVVVRAIRERAPWADPKVDERGNVSVTFGTGSGEKIFIAHMDEIGYEIVSVRPDGTATLRARGGMYDALYEAHPVLVQTARGPVPAVIGPRTGYVGADSAHPRPEDLSAYFGVTSADEVKAMGVGAGNLMTVRKRFVPLAGTRATGRSMDDRSGVAILLSALAAINPAKATSKTTFEARVCLRRGHVRHDRRPVRHEAPRACAARIGRRHPRDGQQHDDAARAHRSARHAGEHACDPGHDRRDLRRDRRVAVQPLRRARRRLVMARALLPLARRSDRPARLRCGRQPGGGDRDVILVGHGRRERYTLGVLLRWLCHGFKRVPGPYFLGAADRWKW
ncbi:MAG: hypothetical protein NTY02_00030 [Acidobacteria bacterium]|nr:hypothetical protein [Acidobacteriota bacterium]